MQMNNPKVLSSYNLEGFAFSRDKETVDLLVYPYYLLSLY